MSKIYFKIHKPVQIVHGVSGEDDTRTPGHRSQAPAQSEPEVSMCMSLSAWETLPSPY